MKRYISQLLFPVKGTYYLMDIIPFFPRFMITQTESKISIFHEKVYSFFIQFKAIDFKAKSVAFFRMYLQRYSIF